MSLSPSSSPAALMSSPPEPSRRGDTAPGSTGGGWMQGPRGVGGRSEGQHRPARDSTAAMGTFPSWLEGGSGAQSQTRREGSLSGPVTEAGHPDGGQRAVPGKLPTRVPGRCRFHPGTQLRCLLLCARQGSSTHRGVSSALLPTGLLRPLLSTGSQPISPRHTQAEKGEQMPP